MKIDEDYITGTAYYIGDGRSTADRSLSTVNVDPKVLHFFCYWLQKYFKANKEHIRVHIKFIGEEDNRSFIEQIWKRNLNCNINSIKKKSNGKPNHQTFADIAFHNKKAKEKYNSLIPLVKKRCLLNKKLAAAYIRGIMAAEGSPKYHENSSSRQVHLKMKNKKEITYIGKLLNNVLNIKTSVLKVNNETGMWIVIVSGYNELMKLSKINVFDLCIKRKLKFDNMINSYKRQQVKKGEVKKFYISNLMFFNKKYNKKHTGWELAPLIGRTGDRTATALRKLMKLGLINGKKRLKTGSPFEFW